MTQVSSEWGEFLTRYQASTNPVELSEALLKGRIWFQLQPSEIKLKNFENFAKIFRNFFCSFKETLSSKDKEKVVEVFGEAVEDWTNLEIQLSTFVGFAEPRSKKIARLRDYGERAKLLFEGIPLAVKEALVEKIKSSDFRSFLERKAGNRDMVLHLEGEEGMEDVRAALAVEDQHSPFIRETEEIIENILLKDEKRKIKEEEGDITGSEAEELIRCYEISGDITPISHYLSGIRIPGFVMPDTNSIRDLIEAISGIDKDTAKDFAVSQTILAFLLTQTK